MVYSRCLKKDFVAVEQLRENLWRIRFSPENEIVPKLNEQGEATGEYEETGYIVYRSEKIRGELTAEKVKRVRLEEISEYDKSPSVNSFVYDGKSMWFDKLTRAAIAYSIQVEKASGAESTVLYDGDNVKHTIPIDDAVEMFASVELYAKACYNVTAQHKAEIDALETPEEVLAYNIKDGYPEPLVFFRKKKSKK